jgi:transcriptional regulator with GAF, ATPase, and Fis domain
LARLYVVATAFNDSIRRPAVLIVDENGPRRQALVSLCEGSGWLVQLVDSSPKLEERDLASIEREHIHRVLVAHGGNVSEAARVLGIHRRTLQRKLRQGSDVAAAPADHPVISPALRLASGR